MPGTDLGRTAASGSGGRKLLNFRERIALSFLAVTLATALAFVLIQMVVWNGQFTVYTRDNMTNIAGSASTALAHEYQVRGYWSSSSLSRVLALDEIFNGLGIQVLNSGGTVIYDNTWIDGSQISLAPGAESVISAAVVVDGVQVGTVNVWAMGSDVLLTPRDINFRNSSFLGMCVAAILGIVLAVIMALLFSTWLSRPIRFITRAAERISAGEHGARSGLRGHDEIGHLGETFDNMAQKFESDRELERRLTADVAHELRTPLQAIMATVEAMQDGVYACDQEHLCMIEEEVKRLSRLVDSMLKLSRLENGSVELMFVELDVIDLVQAMVAARQAMTAESGHKLDFENRTGKETFLAQVDHDSLVQSITNILQNAVRYTPEGGSITVSVAGSADMVQIAVADTGVGIAKDDIDRVFHRFWRSEKSRNRAKGGLGIGMTMTREFVELHHGHIDVESEVGKGTTFTIVLPRTQPGPAGADS